MKRIDWTENVSGDQPEADAVHEFIVRLDQLESDAPAMDPTTVAHNLLYAIENLLEELPEEASTSVDDIRAKFFALTDLPSAD